MVKKSSKKSAAAKGRQARGGSSKSSSGNKSSVKKPASTAKKAKPDEKTKTTAKANPKTTGQRKAAVKGKPTGGISSFPVVGIGASAGGLEACGELLGGLSSNIGVAIILVQHLAPGHTSMLSELLSRTTELPIQEAGDGMVVEANHVYVIPPNCDLSIKNRVLHLTERSQRGMPVDTFLQSLAEDQGSMAIGVILSGSASDGTIGLKNIKACGGITFAQDEKSAKYSSMPHSAIAAGWVDFVLSPAEIARELGRIMREPRVLQEIAVKSDRNYPAEAGDELNRIFILLRKQTGNDFTHYKHSTIRRRIQRRMVLHNLERLKDYLRYLEEEPQEVEELFHDILINVTGFFRDATTFNALKQKVFPKILKGRGEEDVIRIWVAGCSTGEEAYSVAMALVEYLGDRATNTPVQIFASDIDTKAIDKARQGIYPEGIKRDVSPARLQRFFTRVTGGYQVSKAIRDLCLFAVQNVVKDPPFSRMDLVCCRNLLIYMSNMLQKKALQVFHYSLRPDGLLVLGVSESITGSADLFSVVDNNNKVYAKKSDANMQLHHFSPMPSEIRLYSPEHETATDPTSIASMVAQAERTILNEYAPPSVVIDEQMQILHFRGHTGPYIEPAQGSASLNLMKMARPDLLMDLRTMVRRSMAENSRVRQENVPLTVNDEERAITLQVIPLKKEQIDVRLFLILFEDTGPFRLPAAPIEEETPVIEGEVEVDDKDQHIRELERELTSTREYLQTIIEDQETTNEELLSANEEIQSTNEELQSTNEELETAKEELQSTNEELITVNEELEGRNAALSHVNSDLNNLLANVQMPIIMLDEDLVIRHFTPGVTQLFSMIQSDVGRSIDDIKVHAHIPDLDEIMTSVMDTLKPRNMEVRNNAGNWFSLRISPYKTIDNRIAGVVLVFVELTTEVERRLAAVVRDSYDAITLRDFNGNILAWNRQATKIFGYSEMEALNMNVKQLVVESDLEKEHDMVAALRRGEVVGPLTVTRVTKSGKKLSIWLTSTALLDEHNQPYAIATTERLVKPAQS
jgi:two-component system CheB/CheR fusion protein